MITSLCILVIYDLYISLIVLYVRHRSYLNALLHATKENTNDLKSLSANRYFTSCVVPIYRKAYFGYDGFSLMVDDVFTTLVSGKYLRVYGLVKMNSICVLDYHKGVVNTVLVVNDPSYGDTVMEDLRQIYRNVLLLSIGGVLVWNLSLQFMTLSMILPL